MAPRPGGVAPRAHAVGPDLGVYRARARRCCSLRGLRALFASVQELEEASGEILLVAQALRHAGRHERPGRDPSEHVFVPREQLAQLGADVGLRKLWRHRARQIGFSSLGGATKALALQVELCSPRLIASRASARWRASGFRPGSWPQGQSSQSTPLSTVPGRRARVAVQRPGIWHAARLFHRPLLQRP